MQKKILSLAVSILMVFTSISPGAGTVMAQDDFPVDQIREDEEKTITGMETAEETASVLPAAAGTEVQGEIVNGNTHTMTTGTYVVNENVTISPQNGGYNGIQVEKGANVLLYIKEGKTLRVTGRGGDDVNYGYAAILLPEGSTLTVAGKGTLEATGGDAGRGGRGGKAEASAIYSSKVYTGKGGDGGHGGGGAGAGIGTNGGSGGTGGAGGEGARTDRMVESNTYGNDGWSGQAGHAAEPAGTLIVTGSVTVNATGGKAGTGGESGIKGSYEDKKTMVIGNAVGTSGGGGGGAGGSAADGIGSGGTGGGGGGGGASGNIDGEFAFFTACDLDDLWGYGGYGGTGVWGGESGGRGHYGASQNGDDTNASKKHAKSGGWGGSSAEPRAVAFFTYKSNSSDNPKVTCTSGHGVTRSATALGSLQEFKNKGGYPGLVSGGTFVYDGNSHGVTVGGSGRLSAQANSVFRMQEVGEAGVAGEAGSLAGESFIYESSYQEDAGFASEAAAWDDPGAAYEGDSYAEESFNEEAAVWDDPDAAYEGDSYAEESFNEEAAVWDDPDAANEGDSYAEESFIEETSVWDDPGAANEGDFFAEESFIEETSDQENADFASEAVAWEEPGAAYEGDSLAEDSFVEEAVDQEEADFASEAVAWDEPNTAYEGDSLAEESFTCEAAAWDEPGAAYEAGDFAEGSFIYDAVNPEDAGFASEAAAWDEPGTAYEAGDFDEDGETTLDGVPVKYWITYYDASGSRTHCIPMMPGQYVAIVKFESENPDYCGDWIEPFSIIRIPVEKPTPAALTFECEDWETGEGVLQDAFPDLDETWYEFVPDATADDGSVSLRSARAAGSYQACFRLKYPETHEWAGESEETKEVWVPWTIALQEFDPGAPEVTYWGTAYDNTTTTVDYTGEPVWVRPWWTQAKDTDGRFPEWFTHWDSDIDRPTTNRLSSAVFYLEGDDDSEGLVGYHTNADGSFEKVTAEQVYAWVFGVDVGDEHLTVESGDKVWYRTDDDGWKVPLGVGEDQAEGAEGYVVARDYAYADRLGVKDPGTYMAYIAFDDGTGFASTSQAETTVVVREEQSVSERFTAAVNAVPGNKAGEGKGQVDAATAIYETMTEEEKALISPETMDLYNEELAAFTKGRQFRSGDGYYKVLSNGDVTYLKPASRDIRDVKVPNQVKKGKFYFKVIKVSNNAFRDCRNLEWAVISRDVYVFGQNIFAGDGDLKKVRVLGTGFRSGKVTDAFEGTGKNLTVKVPGDKVDEYQELFKNEGRLKGKVVAAS